MASFTVLEIGRQYLLDAAEFIRVHKHPWLVLIPPPQDQAEVSSVTTVARSTVPVGATNMPIAIEVIKGTKPNAFPFGVTVGRTENNDIVLKHEEVSRFHAYFQEQEGKLCVTDADSKNGTWLDGRQLAPLKPAVLPPDAMVRFGRLEVRYFEAERFLVYLEKASAPGKKY